MIIFETHGDILKSDLQTLVCPVNTVGVMGAGLALKFRHAFDCLLVDYRRACLNDELVREGFSLHCYESKRVLCMPTKRDWWDPSRMEYVEASLKAIASTWRMRGIESLAIPAVGCGLGGLHWPDVRELIHGYLGDSQLPVGIYLP